jgi:ABC-type Mn2+/Zn2+ transport system ATPase subunit
MTLVIVSHDLEAAKQNADKILHLGTDSFFFGNVCEYLQSEMGKRFSN